MIARQRQFGPHLRSLRTARGLTMSAIARALNVSVVYYREVEAGTRRPFSSLKTDFAALAALLDTNAEELQLLAAAERGQLEFDFEAARREERRVAILFAQRLRTGRMSKASLRKIAKILAAG